ncbi:MAG: ATP-binding protein [Bacteroidia bacterium]
MFIRPIFNLLEEHLIQPDVTVLTGMRRTGKTTALKYLLEKTPHENKLYLDLERLEYRRIFTQNSFREMQADIEFLGYDFSSHGVIAIDEVQLIPEVVSFIKYYYDHFQVKFLISGSSSYYLKNRITESLAGRKQIFEIFPLDFPEFLTFKSVDITGMISRKMQPYRPLVFSTYQHYYEEYLRYGGFPQVVLSDSSSKKEQTLRDILNSYLELDVKILSDYSVIDDLYKMVTLLCSRIGSKLDYQKMGVLTGLSRHKIRDYIQLFKATYFLNTVSPYSVNPDRSIAIQPKIYLADTGLIGLLAQVSSGALFENAIANQLLRLGKVNYYQKKSGQEIDFILNETQAIEVKETPSPSDLKVLQSRAALIGLSDSMLIGRYPPGIPFADFVWGGCVF